jgi:hypothetical protein
MASRIRRGYRAITTVFREQDVAQAKRIADDLRLEGLSNADRSLVIRWAMVTLGDQVQGKSPQEVLRAFLDRCARKPRPDVVPPGTLGGAKA